MKDMDELMEDFWFILFLTIYLVFFCSLSIAGIKTNKCKEQRARRLKSGIDLKKNKRYIKSKLGINNLNESQIADIILLNILFFIPSRHFLSPQFKFALHFCFVCMSIKSLVKVSELKKSIFFHRFYCSNESIRKMVQE